MKKDSLHQVTSLEYYFVRFCLFFKEFISMCFSFILPLSLSLLFLLFLSFAHCLMIQYHLLNKFVGRLFVKLSSGELNYEYHFSQAIARHRAELGKIAHKAGEMLVKLHNKKKLLTLWWKCSSKPSSTTCWRLNEFNVCFHQFLTGCSVHPPKGLQSVLYGDTATARSGYGCFISFTPFAETLV